MQPADTRPLAPPRPPPFAFADDAGGSSFDSTPTAPVGVAPLRLAAPALFVEARFRGVPLASRLLRADELRAFAIGNARGCDAPVNPAWLPETGAPHDFTKYYMTPLVVAGIIYFVAASKGTHRVEQCQVAKDHSLPPVPE